MRIDVTKYLSQAAAPLTVLALLLAVLGGVMAGQRLDRVSRKPTAPETRVLLARVRGTLDSLHRQSTASSYPLEKAIQMIKAKQPPPAVATVASPAVVAEKSQPIPLPAPEPMLRVIGIISNEQHVLVCVNNRILGVGGSVEGFKVVKIEPNQVTFDNQKGRIRVITFK